MSFDKQECNPLPPGLLDEFWTAFREGDRNDNIFYSTKFSHDVVTGMLSALMTLTPEPITITPNKNSAKGAQPQSIEEVQSLQRLIVDNLTTITHSQQGVWKIERLLIEWGPFVVVYS